MMGIAGIVGLSAFSLYQWSSMHHWVTRTQEVTGAFNECLSSILEVDEARRGYIFNTSPLWKSGFSGAQNRANTTLQRLTYLTRDNKSQQDRLQQLRSTIITLNQANYQLMHTRDTQGFDATLASIRKTNANAKIVDSQYGGRWTQGGILFT